jgi:signal transduction histidine kinase
VDLAALVDRRLPAWRALAEERGRSVVAELLPSPAVRVRPEALVQALQVLLDNALEHGEGTVTVRVAPARPDEPDVAVRVCVADEGPGPDAVIERPDGRGLPLARALVAAEGGRLTVAGSDGGTRVCLVVPARRG